MLLIIKSRTAIKAAIWRLRAAMGKWHQRWRLQLELRKRFLSPPAPSRDDFKFAAKIRPVKFGSLEVCLCMKVVCA